MDSAGLGPFLRPLAKPAEGMRRGNLKPVGIYLFWLVNNCLFNLLGIPVGTLRGLDSDGRCFLRTAPKNESGPNLSTKCSRC